MAQKTQIPKGTRDFSQSEMLKRNYLFDTIKRVFEKYCYLPIETPAMENLTTLLGKYGAEGDKLLFKILNSGNFLKQVNTEDIDEKNLNALALKISEKGLRYDLTVPFARYVSQNRNDINFPFKRYQIQTVWRADRPQRGRYREFFQCDVDVIGSNSLLNEIELIQIADEIFANLKIGCIIKLNNRKILSGIAEHIGESEKIIDITIAIDKIEKIGLDKVISELSEKGISETSIEKLIPILKLSGTNSERIIQLKNILKNSEIGNQGIIEVEQILTLIQSFSMNSEVVLDLTLARGLNYYTGAIFEIVATDMNIGSICGGGRYDDLTSIFGLPNVSGVGISFGADRIFDVLNQLELYPKYLEKNIKLMIVNFGDEVLLNSLQLLEKLRKENIKAELYPDSIKVKKQLNYANKRNVEYIAMLGQDEIANNLISLKNMKTGDQHKVNFEDLLNILQK
ncbi:MAG: histidine--tRNA ligase [Bacteroidetes bacterium]|jgi:histidyl-tRNA synthetase|nr:histidine--tRNA ligase [Bacteroidota bacterium]MBT6685318.1 histidine--tRNA ligase [Bacteroidota bacterium]MBT7142876.1 histidine--tRNA ligase [Bacteroidota bacterium]MBT7490357.1 histidine--tRNA ligase [Bacteroidota bacterium]